ncbi:GGDEF domain-containing protein [Oryzifoliimicrobium ureilyticus]|uniref:GGDEF domain-containing protein n=1 Tax=Oryzifoliimicrobium ureilyticus TaxID=3113724 RepID=UPI003075F417
MFNFQTAIAVWCSEATTLSLVLFMAWRQDRQSKSYFYWGLGFLLNALGFGMLALAAFIPQFMPNELGNAIALAGQTACIAGFAALDKRKIAWWALLSPAIWLSGIFLPWIYNDLASRIILYNLAYATGAAGLAMAAGMVEGGREGTGVKLSAVFVLQAVLSFGTALSLALFDQDRANATDYGLIAMVGNYLLLIFAFAFACQLVIERGQKQLYRLTITDTLTGALNRRGLLGVFDRFLQKSLDEKKQVAVLLFDLDRFKQINDKLGHQAGDAVLAQFARIARRHVAGNLFGRMGGEEFAAFAAVSDQYDAEALAETIRSEFCYMPISTGDAIVPATVSIGVSIAEPAEANLQKMMSSADKALYAAKAAGRNRTVVFGKEETARVPEHMSEQSGDLVPTVDDQIEALRRIEMLARAG